MSQPYDPYPSEPDQPLPPIQVSAYDAADAVKDLTLSGTLSAVSAGVVALSSVAGAVTVGPFLDAPADSLGAAAALYGASALILTVGLLAGFVTTGIWLFRARRNAEAFAPEWTHKRSAGWAWGGWVVPIVSLWFPFQVVRDVDRASHGRRATPPLLGWWWGLWLAVLLLERISSSVVDAAVTDLDLVGTAQGLTWVAAVLTIPAAVLWMLVVRRVTTVQHARMRGVLPA